MSDYRRFYVTGATYFFTVVTHKRQPMLCDDKSRAALRHAVSLTRRDHPFVVIAWILLPDHLHCIWEMPQHDADFSTRWRLIKARFTRELIHAPGRRPPAASQSASRIRRREQPIWQRRFWEHCMRDQDDLNRHINYIHFNPVKHGRVADPREWPFSTVHRPEYRMAFDPGNFDPETISQMECE